MNGVNKAIIVGTLGRDPEFRHTSNSELCNLSVATSESWKDKLTGEKKEKTEWHKVVVWNEHLVKVCKFLEKGSKVYIEGQIVTRKYEKDGREVYTTEIVLQKYKGDLSILSGSSGGQKETIYGDDEYKSQTGHNAAKANGYVNDPAMQGPLDTDVPF